MQAILGHIPIETSDLQNEANKMIQIAERMVNSLIEYFQTDQFIHNSIQTGRYNSLLSAVCLAKSLKTRIWYNHHFKHVLNEMNLAESDVNKLIRDGIDSVDTLLKTNPREIEDVSFKRLS